MRLPILLVALAPLVQASAPPSAAVQGDTDIFLATLTMREGRIHVGTPRNLTARRGYDNQPSFSRDGAWLYFTSVRDDAQADIYRIALPTGRVERVTHTAPESEYSAAEVPGGGAISVIRVERDSAQRLWRLPLGAGAPEVLFPALAPVGYHAWADSAHVVMFVLGSPAVLAVGTLPGARVDTVLRSVGRSMHRIPGSQQVSVVSKAYADPWWIMALDMISRDLRPVARLPHGSEDYAWLPDGRLVAGSGSTLLVCDPRTDAVWHVVADLAAAGLSDITRLAVSPAGDQLAIVAAPRAR